MMVRYSMKTISHKFVKLIPDQLENGILYISIKYCTAIHKCCCGCQEEVVTPLSPTDWQLTFNGESISLYPSIGNWNFDCKSHYWITNNRVEWERKWSRKEINAGRRQDYLNKREYYSKKSLSHNRNINGKDSESKNDKLKNKKGFLLRMKKWWS